MTELLNGLTGIQAIVIMLSLHLVMGVIKFALGLFKKKTEVTDNHIVELTTALGTTTDSLKALNDKVLSLDTKLSEIPKLKKDLRRYYFAIKALAGDKWPEISKTIQKDEAEADDFLS